MIDPNLAPTRAKRKAAARLALGAFLLSGGVRAFAADAIAAADAALERSFKGTVHPFVRAKKSLLMPCPLPSFPSAEKNGIGSHVVGMGSPPPECTMA